MRIRVDYIPSIHKARWIYGPLGGQMWRQTWDWRPTAITAAVEVIESFK